MSNITAHHLKCLLGNYPAGLTAKQLSSIAGLSQQWVIKLLRDLPAHIDHYEKRSKTGRLAAVWVLGEGRDCRYPDLQKDTLRKKRRLLK